MANYSTIIETINTDIRENGLHLITGNVLNGVLNGMVGAIRGGYLYMGKATPSLNPAATDARVFYFATTAGTYNHLGGLTLQSGQIGIFRYDTAWHLDTFDVAGGVQSNTIARIEAVTSYPSVEEQGVLYVKTQI